MRAHRNLLRTTLAATLLLTLLALPGAVENARAASIQAAFNSAWQDFHALVKDSKRGKYRSYWTDLGKRFFSVHKRNPKGALAPKAYYYYARTYEELGKRSHNHKDFRTAAEAFARTAELYSRHAWADDCLYRKAYLEYKYLKDYEDARDTLNTVLRDYTRGDMYQKARHLHAEVRKAQATAKPVRKEPRPEQEQAGAKPEHHAMPAPVPPKKPRGPGNYLESVRYQSSDSYTRIVVGLTDEAPYRYQILDPVPSMKKPHRLYVDFEGVRVAEEVPEDINIADGILRRVRTGQNSPKKARVVLDFQDFQEYKIFALDNPYRLVIDVSAPEKDAKRTAKRPSKQSAKKQHAQAKPEKYHLPPGSKGQVGDLIEQLGLTVQTIMIDAGHGGKDPGAQANGIREKDVNLKFAKMLGKKLKSQGFEVLYTRTKDVFIPLEERTAMANVRKADLFISIHCNAHKKSNINGFEIYYLNLARSKAAVRVAARENAVTTKRISDLQFILTDLMLNSKMKESKELAANVHDVVIKDIRKKYTLTDHGVRTAPFYVLMGAKMPSILIELGYITNPTESKRLKSETYLKRKVEAIARGVGVYKKQIERFASL